MPTHHAKHSPSSFHRRLHCPGSLAYEAIAPATQSGKDSERGTFVHALGEKSLLKKRHPKAFIGKRIKYEQVDFDVAQMKSGVVDKDAAYCAGRYYDYVKSVAKGSRVHAELCVEVLPEMWGTADCVFIRNGTLYVVDYKNGYIQVDPRKNVQLMIYGLGALARFKKAKVERICLVIIQPNGDGDTVKEWSLSRKRLLSFLPVLKRAIHRIESDPVLKIGPGCNWCKAATFCPERYRFVKNLDTSNLETTSILALQEILNSKDLVTSYFARIEANFQYLISRGARIDSHKIVQKRAMVRWKQDNDQLLETFVELGYPKKYIRERMTKTTPRTPGQLKGTLSDRHLAMLSEKKSSGVKLVKAGDPGEPVNTLIQDFED